MGVAQWLNLGFMIWRSLVRILSAVDHLTLDFAITLVMIKFCLALLAAWRSKIIMSVQKGLNITML